MPTSLADSMGGMAFDSGCLPRDSKRDDHNNALTPERWDMKVERRLIHRTSGVFVLASVCALLSSSMWSSTLGELALRING